MGCIETLLPREGAGIQRGWSFHTHESVGPCGPPLGWQSVARSLGDFDCPWGSLQQQAEARATSLCPGAPPLLWDALTAEAPHLLVPLEGRD